MTRVVLTGLTGSSPLGFLGAMGLLRVLSAHNDATRLGFLPDGSFHPFVEAVDTDIATLVSADASVAATEQGWRLAYEKKEKRGVKTVADLKAPPAAFARFLSESVAAWVAGNTESTGFAAAFGTSVAVDGKGNTKPTAYHFTAANQQFLGTVEAIRASVTREWAERSLIEGHAARPGLNLRWDPAAERNWALMANNPNDDGTSVDAPLEWLAFRGLPLFPVFPAGTRVVTTAVRGRGDEMAMNWPLWSLPVSLSTVRSLLQLDWLNVPPRERAQRGVFAVCSSPIRRTAQGFGNFGPAMVAS